MDKFKISACALTDIGRVRKNNEDSVYIGGQKIKLYAVCDGMGGESFGEIASEIAVKQLHELSGHLDDTELLEDLDLCVDDYVDSANNKICDEITIRGQSMGTTLALVCIDGETAHCYNIGDSRIYLWRNGELKRISEDHTVAERFLKIGAITPEQARKHYGRNLLTQNLGISHNEMAIELYKAPVIQLIDGDRLFICSDGLTDMCNDEQINEFFIFNQTADCEYMAKSLINLANANGGLDNISVVVICVDSENSISPASD